MSLLREIVLALLELAALAAFLLSIALLVALSQGLV